MNVTSSTIAFPERELPRISIITPSFNQADFLEKTVQSVLGQNYPNLEYIIIDGGSRDGSVDIIRKYENRLAYWVSEPDKGHYDAVNKGMAKATGDIVAWINSDDMYVTNALQTVGSVMAELPQVKWLSSLNGICWDSDGAILGIFPVPGFSREAFLDGEYLPFKSRHLGWIQQESTFWHRSLWEQAGGRIRTEFTLAGDFDLWSRFYGLTDLYGIDAPLGGYRKRQGQRSEDMKKYLEEAARSLTELRSSTGWGNRSFQNALVRSRLFEIPGLRKHLRKLGGYDGHRVVKARPGLANSGWIVKEQTFP